TSFFAGGSIFPVPCDRAAVFEAGRMLHPTRTESAPPNTTRSRRDTGRSYMGRPLSDHAADWRSRQDRRIKHRLFSALHPMIKAREDKVAGVGLGDPSSVGGRRSAGGARQTSSRHPPCPPLRRGGAILQGASRSESERYHPFFARSARGANGCSAQSVAGH